MLIGQAEVGDPEVTVFVDVAGEQCTSAVPAGKHKASLVTTTCQDVYR
jgi:hypothetical protein